MTQFIEILSEVLGWFYVVLWGFSFYPMVWNIYKLKSAEGLKTDYLILNNTGYIFLCAYTTAGYIDKSIGIGDILIDDLIFCYNGLMMTICQLCLLFFYPRGKNRMGKIFAIEFCLLWAITAIYFLITHFGLINPILNQNIWQLMGYNKLVISFTKYFPQVHWNYKRKSTFGWSIYSTWCDSFGGIFSITQTLINKYHAGKEINIVKFVLGIITIFFDILLFTQHYVLYPNKDITSENMSLNKIRQSDSNIEESDDTIEKPLRN